MDKVAAEQVRRALAERGAYDALCSICAAAQWRQADSFAVVVLADPPFPAADSHVFSGAVVLTCERCGNMNFVSLAAVGLGHLLSLRNMTQAGS